MKIKTLLIGALVVSPTVFYWARRIDPPTGTQATPGLVAAGPRVSIPIEVIENGSAPKWIDVKVGY